jgi:uncharacterized damage-inducible protein DinB
VGRATWAFLQGPVDEDRVVALHDAPEERYSLGDLLWHAFLHEARHWGPGGAFFYAFWGWSLPLRTSTFP